jgi:mycofactocin precursor
MLEPPPTAIDAGQAEPIEPPDAPHPAVAEARGDTTVEASEDTMVEADLLVEDVSIDGMCGVY